jgi:hypothetical protein
VLTVQDFIDYSIIQSNLEIAMIDEDAAREALVMVAAAERDLVALQIRSNAIGNFITGGFLGACTVFC